MENHNADPPNENRPGQGGGSFEETFKGSVENSANNNPAPDELQGRRLAGYVIDASLRVTEVAYV
ncbi:hypothetical protein BH10PSE7_BH10PSE7_34030 [soil metagenome]